MVTVSLVLHEWTFILVKIGTLFLGKSSCEDGFGVVSFGHFEPQSYQNRHLNDTTSQNIAGVQCGKAVHILLVPRMRVNQSFKQKINL